MNSTGPGVRVNDGHGERHIAPERVYFAFGSGRLTYDCVSCNARCCRGEGYRLNEGRELDVQLASSPLLRIFLDPCDVHTTNHHHVRNCAPGCFFLTRDGLCRVHAEHGYAAKPETCRLFPFNHFSRVGDYLIVAPHHSLCPLQVAAPGARSDDSRHELLLAAMEGGGIRAHVHEASPIIPAVGRLIALERSITSLSENGLRSDSYLHFAAAQLVETRKVIDGISEPSFEVAHEEVQRCLELVFGVLGVQPPAAGRDEALVRTMVGITPALRAQVVLTPHGQQPHCPALPLARLPYVLTSVYALVALAREAGMVEVTYQTVTRLFTEYRWLLMLLASLDRIMVWNMNSPVDLSPCKDRALYASYINTLRDLLPRRQRRAEASLGAILSGNAGCNGLARIAFLKTVARRLAQHLVPLEEGGLVTTIRRPKAMLQAWAVGRLPTPLLIKMSEARLAAHPHGAATHVSPADLRSAN